MEQVATNALIANIVSLILHGAITVFSFVAGVLLYRYRQENIRQQEQIDECRRIISGMDEKLDNVLKAKEGD